MSPQFKTTALIVPTLNAECVWESLVRGIKAQNLSNDQVMIIDSSSDDQTLALAQRECFRTLKIPRESFSHGGTRQMAVDLLAEFSIHAFMTQDAILCGDSSIAKLVTAFENPQVGAAFGRQLPRLRATPIEAHARLFNYPDHSSLRAFEHRRLTGFKTIFLSNSFAAYRSAALHDVHGFPRDVIFGEDTVTAARLLRKGWLISYVAEAQAIHSHHYSFQQEFKRYFDIGVLHARETSLLEEFGGATGEGKKFVLSELAHLSHTNPFYIPSSLLRTGLKLAAYQFGRRESRLPLDLKRRLSMNQKFWDESIDTSASQTAATRGSTL